MKRILPGVLALLAAAPAAAHRLDECLQGAFVLVGTNRVSIELDLTPGVAVADGILAIADTDRDGVVDQSEARAFAWTVTRSISLEVDGVLAPLSLVGTAFPSAAELKSGNGVIQIECETGPVALGAGTHRVAYRNRWAPVPSVYLANALMPSAGTIRVTGQRRSTNQSELVVELAVDGTREATATRWTPWICAATAAVVAIGGWVWRRTRAGAQGSTTRTRYNRKSPAAGSGMSASSSRAGK